MGTYIDFYCGDNNKELKKIVNAILKKHFSSVSQSEYDNFYSIAADVVWKCEKRFDENKSDRNFNEFLVSCIYKKIKSRMTYLNRGKRKVKFEDKEGNIVYVAEESLDAPISDDNNITLKDRIQSNFNMEDELTDSKVNGYDEKVERYLENLSKTQKQIAEMIMDGYLASEIKESLELTEKEYQDHMKTMRSYDKAKHLIRDLVENPVPKKEDMDMEEKVVVTTAEKTKNTSYAVAAISKKLKKHFLRDDHVLQRSSGQWNRLFKSELISDILQGKSLTQIIISEEVKNGVTMHWLIDGKQRCTNIDEFLHDKFSISKNVQRYEIEYQTTKKDENGEDLLNSDGFPILINHVFDIRNKKFSQLPEELQDRILEYQVPVMLNMNSDKKEIAYDIARFNRCRPMNIAQNGWTGLEETFAEFVDNILKMDFFQAGSPKSKYSGANNTSGGMRRMIVESIMAINFLDNFNKDFGKMCSFLSEEANDGTFIDFYALMEEFSEVATEDIAEMFDIKDSFLWFAIFSRFKNLEIENNRFIDFLRAFQQRLHSKELDGITYDSLNEKSTKDKSVVIVKLEHLEKLMREFFDAGDVLQSEINELEFVQEIVNQKVTEEDLEQYEEILEDLTLNVDNNSKLLHKQNHPSLVAIVAYSFSKDIDLDDWIVDYFDKNNMYRINQKQNFLHMKKDLEEFVSNKEKKSA